MALGKVLARGQVTLPREIRRAARIKPGDVVSFRVAGPGHVEIALLPRLRLSDLLDRYHVEGPVDEAVERPRWQETAAEDVLGEPSV